MVGGVELGQSETGAGGGPVPGNIMSRYAACCLPGPKRKSDPYSEVEPSSQRNMTPPALYRQNTVAVIQSGVVSHRRGLDTFFLNTVSHMVGLDV